MIASAQTFGPYQIGTENSPNDDIVFEAWERMAFGGLRVINNGGLFWCRWIVTRYNLGIPCC